MAAHAGTHERGGNDPIRLDDLAEPQDNVDLNANTVRHGLLKKLSGTSTDVLHGDGTFGPSGAAVNSDHFVTTQAESDLSNEFSLGSLTTGLLKHSVSAGVSTPATASPGSDYVAPGAITSSGLTQTTARLLGRTTASTGAIEEITIGSGLSLSSGSLSATGSTGTAIVQIAQIVTTGSQTTVDFTSISGAYSALKVVWMSQDTTAGTGSSGLRLMMNNDSTAGNYTATARSGSEGGTAFSNTSAANTKGQQVSLQPNTGNTGKVVNGELVISGYAATTFQKRWTAFSGWSTATFGDGVMTSSGLWANTAAVTRLTFGTDGTAFTDGSMFTLYGLP